VIDYGFTGAEMSAEDRITNPLGFQVTRYRKDPETLPIAVENEGLPEAEPIPSSMDGTAAAEAGE
jgi:type IV secretion system protein VirB8